MVCDKYPTPYGMESAGMKDGSANSGGIVEGVCTGSCRTGANYSVTRPPQYFTNTSLFTADHHCRDEIFTKSACIVNLFLHNVKSF